MRILQVCPYDIDRHGGVQRHILDLSAAFRELGHEVKIVTPHMPGADQAALEANDNIARVGKGHLLSFNKTAFEFSWCGRDDLKIVDQLLNDADVVHIHALTTPFLAWRIFARSRGVNVASFHDFPPETRFGAVQKALHRRFTPQLAARLEGLIVTTATMQGHVLVDRAPVSAILPPCTDLSRFGPSIPPAVSYSDQRINILFLGRLEPRKGAMALLQAYARLEKDGLPVRLLIIGEGRLRPRLESFVAEQQLQFVVFAGSVPQGESPHWYSACDIFCAPSLYGEGFGIVLTEAMASQKPVVAANNQGYRTVLSRGPFDTLVPPGDVWALADRLRLLVLDKAERDRLGALGVTEAKKYDARTLAPEFIAVYQQAISAHKKRRRG